MNAVSGSVADKMKRQRRRDTPCEVLVRKRIYALGLRYRVDFRPEPSVRRKADIVFPKAKLAIFIDGCFWHLCPLHRSWPKHNGAWWREKLNRNKRRDSDTTTRLSNMGWIVLRFWEHDDPDRVAHEIARNYRCSEDEDANKRDNSAFDCCEESHNGTTLAVDQMKGPGTLPKARRRRAMRA